MKADHSRIAGHIDLLVVLEEFPDLRVLTEIAEPAQMVFPAMRGRDTVSKILLVGQFLDLMVIPY